MTFRTVESENGEMVTASFDPNLPSQDRYVENPLNFDSELHLYQLQSGRRRGTGALAQFAGLDAFAQMNYPSSPSYAPTSTGPDAPKQNQIPRPPTETRIQWIRIDPNLQWMMRVNFKQPQYMWLNQLLYDNDVFAQLHALQNLRSFTARVHLHQFLSFTRSQAVLTAFNSMLQQPQIFYRVRTRSAYMLAFLTSTDNDWIGLNYLFHFFKSNFFYSDTQQVRHLLTSLMHAG